MTRNLKAYTVEDAMPNMDYPGPCLSCIDHTCGLWDENLSERKDEKKRDNKDEKK
ncbi:hypothetical protein [Pseudodesulfovibrio sediminis]|uniref:Uncharacterized protein n=1 Tax=Pseudodesulfovibrio sediminis TaxID=2810563 RepID=A0ABN6ETD5_9BACT|nr:hypothetical protein [Pseudodesulfovibrio sediminis]BCS89611.1 hypothetical protein PSDVSF_28530 [Pseudodesulfovibrio sediminis]